MQDYILIEEYGSINIYDIINDFIEKENNYGRI